MNKRMLVLTALLVLATGLVAQHKPEFSLRVHPIRDSFAVREIITLEVTTTNLTDRTLDSKKYQMPYTYIAKRDGVPAKKIDQSETVGLDPKGLPPHHSVTGDEYVQHYVDMSQPGKYTIQLQQGNVKSNVVTVTVIP